MNIRKSLLILVIPILLMALSSLGGLAYLAEAHPYGPGHPLYVTQETAQQWEMLLASDPAYRAACALEIAECRLTDLAYASTPAEIDQMLIGLDQALQQANECLAAAPESARATMQTTDSYTGYHPIFHGVRKLTISSRPAFRITEVYIGIQLRCAHHICDRTGTICNPYVAGGHDIKNSFVTIATQINLSCIGARSLR